MITAKRQRTRNEMIAIGPYGLGDKTLDAKRHQAKKAIHLWRDRLDFWEAEFQQFERIAQLQLNGKKRYIQALNQYFVPYRKAIEEELLALQESLNFMEQRIKATQSGAARFTNIMEHRWNRLEVQLLNFEVDLRGKKKRFLAMLYHTLPIGII